MVDKEESIMVLPEGTTIEVNGVTLGLIEDVYVSSDKQNISKIIEILEKKESGE